ncbi:hypothetical protein Tco_0625118 [Tanacetum coccineum]|uniref:DUF4283 domain-containing protein n=1 Tax=Tanacetum coccineum TaxID=301880 RepID=A0ABQ4WFW6_9ASTR
MRAILAELSCHNQSPRHPDHRLIKAGIVGDDWTDDSVVSRVVPRAPGDVTTAVKNDTHVINCINWIIPFWIHWNNGTASVGKIQVVAVDRLWETYSSIFDRLDDKTAELTGKHEVINIDWRINAPKDEMPVRGSYFAEDVAVLNTRRTPIQKQPEALLCIVGLSRRYFLGDDVYPTFLNDDDREMDVFNLISAPNPTKVRTETRPRAAHEVPLLTITANRVIDMEDATVASGSSGTPSTMEKSPLDFANEDSPQRITKGDGTTETRLEKEVAAMGTPVNERHRKRDNAKAEANAPPKVLRNDHAPVCPEQSTRGGKSLAAMGLEVDSTFNSAAQKTPADVDDPEPLSYAKPHPHFQQDIAQSSRVPATEIPARDVATTEVPGLFSAESPESKRSMSIPSVAGSPGAIYQPG